MKQFRIKPIIMLMLLICMAAAFIINASQCISTGSASSENTNTSEAVKLPVSKVAIVQSKAAHAKDIDYPEIQRMVREAVALAGGFGGLIRDGDTVVLKPNLVTITDYTHPGWQGKPLSPEANGTTTDYRITRAVVELVREVNPGGKIYVMEGSSVPTKTAFLHHKYTSAFIPGVDAFISIEAESGNWGDEKSDKLVKVELPDGLCRKSYFMNRIYYEADFLISLPCLKNHWHAVITGAVKNISIGASPGNIYGKSMEWPGRNDMVDHLTIDLHYWIHDFYMARPADFAVMDGLQGIQNGPTPCFDIAGRTDLAQDQMDMRLILAGRDPVAIDTIEALLMGWDPQSVEYLNLLNTSKAGNIDTSCIDVAGKRVDEVRKVFKGNVVNSDCRGRLIPEKNPPKAKVIYAAVTDNKLHLSLEPGNTLHFIKLILDKTPLGENISGNFNAITLDTGDRTETGSELVIETYDRYLNAGSITLKLPFTGDAKYLAAKAAVVPVIDGSGDDVCWQTASWFPISQLWEGAAFSPDDFSGRFKLCWTPGKLCLLAEITDDILRDPHLPPLVEYYNDDTLEVFVDENASGGEHTYSYNAFAYHISLSFDVADIGADRMPRLFNDHAHSARIDKGKISTWEVTLDIYDETFKPGSKNKPVVLFAGKRIGFALAYCDNDAKNERESFIGSEIIEGADKNIAWKNADVFGSLLLVE